MLIHFYIQNNQLGFSIDGNAVNRGINLYYLILLNINNCTRLWPMRSISAGCTHSMYLPLSFTYSISRWSRIVPGSFSERDLSDTPPSSSTSQSRVNSTNGCTTATLSSQFGHSPVNGQEAFRPLASRSNFLSGQQIGVRFPQANYPSATS